MWADRMRIAVMGSGGLGGFFGARLAVGRANTVGLPDDYAEPARIHRHAPSGDDGVDGA
ncbi:MAG: hypothetical protein ACXWVB_05300 [Rhodoplanes sp.]